MAKVIARLCPKCYCHYWVNMLNWKLHFSTAPPILPVEDCSSGSRKLVVFNLFSQRSLLNFNDIDIAHAICVTCITRFLSGFKRSSAVKPEKYISIVQTTSSTASEKKSNTSFNLSVFCCISPFLLSSCILFCGLQCYASWFLLHFFLSLSVPASRNKNDNTYIIAGFDPTS